MAERYARCVGGPIDGRQVRAQALVYKVPVVTEEFTRAYHEWAEVYGAAWAMSDHDETQVLAPPPMPSVTYRRDSQTGDYIFVAD